MFIKANISFFFYLGFFHEHSRLTGQQEKGEGIYLTPLYRFYLLHRHLDIMKLSGGLLQREITKNQKYHGYKFGLASMVCTCFDKKNSGDAATLAQSENLIRKIYLLLKNENMSNKELAEELHKPIIRKFKKRKV